MNLELFNGLDPLREMREFNDRMQRFFGIRLPNTLEGMPGIGQLAALPGTFGAWPSLNLWETAEGYELEAELPGMKIEELEVAVSGNEVSIRGERKMDDANDGRTWHRRERGVGTFTRTLTLPKPVNAEKVGATLKDGVLSVHLPKAEEAKPRKISVSA